MKKAQPSAYRTRAEILASIASLPDSVQGSISSYTVTTRSGKAITYHTLQHWAETTPARALACVGLVYGKTCHLFSRDRRFDAAAWARHLRAQGVTLACAEGAIVRQLAEALPGKAEYGYEGRLDAPPPARRSPTMRPTSPRTWSSATSCGSARGSSCCGHQDRRGGAIIQAGSVVHGEIPPLAIAGGNPAKVFAHRDAEHFNRPKAAGKFH